MPILTNSAEGGNSGANVTTLNSGGASQNPFDTVVNPTGTTLQFSNAHAAHGNLSYRVAAGAASAQVYGAWSASVGSANPMWFRAYLYFTANPGSNFEFVQFLQGTNSVGAFSVGTVGKIRALNAAGAVILTSTNTIPLNAWFRVEGFAFGSATVGQLEFRLFKTNMDGIGPDEVDTSAATQVMFGAPNTIRFGNTPAAANVGYWMDDIGVSTTGYLGPAGPQPAPPPLPNFPAYLVSNSGWRSAGHSR